MFAKTKVSYKEQEGADVFHRLYLFMIAFYFVHFTICPVPKSCALNTLYKSLINYKMFSLWWWGGGAVVSTVCMFSLGDPASSHHPKTCRQGYVVSLKILGLSGCLSMCGLATCPGCILPFAQCQLGSSPPATLYAG